MLAPIQATVRPSRTIPVLAGAGLLGVAATLGIALAGNVDWGSPGTPAYETYQLVNRITSVAIGLLMAAPLALAVALAPIDRARGTRRVVLLVAVALVGMVIGSAAEFWLFTGQPYRGPGSEGRNLAWMTFLLSGVSMLVLSVVVGIGLLRRRLVPAWTGVAVALAPPIGILAATQGASMFIGIPLVGFALCIAAIAVPRGR